MRILEISLFHSELIRGGAQQAAYELFLGMRRGGVDATLLASAWDERTAYEVGGLLAEEAQKAFLGKPL